MNLWATSGFEARPNGASDLGGEFFDRPSAHISESHSTGPDGVTVNGAPDPEHLAEIRLPVGPFAPLIVSSQVDASVTVADEESLVLETTATILGCLEVFGRADIYGRVLGRVTVHPSGWLNLYGYVLNDVAIEPGGTAHIAGFVKGSVVGRGRHGGVITAQAIVLGRRIRPTAQTRKQ